ncbi:MAG: hypothetical protein DME70_01250, partial [Verrucomicrobia bacterium]
MRTVTSGISRLYYSVPFESGTTESASQPIKGGNLDVDYKFALPEGRFLNVRFDPINRAGSLVTISHARVIDRSGNLIRSIMPERFKRLQQIERLEVNGPDTIVLTGPTADHPALLLDLGSPLILKNYAGPSHRTLLRRFAIAFGPSLVFLLLFLPILGPKIKAPVFRLSRRALSWARVSPARVIFLT